MIIDEIMALAPVIPVLVIEDLSHARPIAEALVAGGLPVLEVTLRTRVALAAIEVMAMVPGAIVGAGSVKSDRQLWDSVSAGAGFIVSPGLTSQLVGAALDQQVP